MSEKYTDEGGSAGQAAAPTEVYVGTWPTVAELVREADRRTGREHVPFVDHDWAKGPAGGVDLFAEFSRQTGRCIGLHEAFIRVPGLAGIVGVYLVPLERAGPFTAYLDAMRVDLADGGAVIPRHARVAPDTLDPRLGPDALRLLAGCHMIAPVVFAADHPAVAEVRAAAAA